MIYPEFLQRGGMIGVTAPSDGNSGELDYIRLESGEEKLQKLGYPVVETANVRTSENGKSSSAQDRAAQLMGLLEHKKVKAIVSAAGGDYLCEMLSYLDFEKIKKYPKWIQGYSDNTGILFTITTMCGIATLYGNNFNDFGMESWHPAVINNMEILKGNLVEQESFDFYEDGFSERVTGLEGYREDKPVNWKHTGAAKEVVVKGRLIGGCMDVLLNLAGTRFDHVKEFIKNYKEDGILWYLETFEANSESLARSLWQLKEAGWFQYASGFVFGRPCMYESHWDIPYGEVVERMLSPLGVPIILDADIGHKGPQFTMMNGSFATIWCGDGKGRVRQEIK